MRRQARGGRGRGSRRQEKVGDKVEDEVGDKVTFRSSEGYFALWA